MLWKPGASYARIIEMEAGSSVEKLRINADHEDWQQLRVLQLLVSHDSEAETGGDRTVETRTAATETRTEAEPLSPIQEVSHETDTPDFNSDASSYSKHENIKNIIENVHDGLEEIIAAAAEEEENT